MSKVAVVIGSDSDLAVISQALEVLEEFRLDYEISIISAHRCPEETAAYAKKAEERGFLVIIAAAGLAAHLPGVIASHTILPVIGVPVASGHLNGQDSLYSIVQMPPGVPVAVVGINAAKNAGLLAVQIVALQDRNVREQFRQYKEKMRREVVDKNSRLQKEGFKNYLDGKKK